MTDLQECGDCGHIFPVEATALRRTMNARSHVAPGDCLKAEDSPCCPLCDSLDLYEAILDVRDMVRILGDAMPGHDVQVEARGHSAAIRTIGVALTVDDRRYPTIYSSNSEDRAGKVFRLALQRVLDTHKHRRALSTANL